MGLGKGVAPAICEHAVLTRTVDLAWPDDAPRQLWGRQQTPVERHDLLEVKTRRDCERVRSVIFDLTQLVFAFPKLGRQWIRTHGILPYATFEDDVLEKALSRCIESGWTVGTVDQLSSGRYVVDVDTFTDEMLLGFLVDRLVDVKRGVTKMLPNVQAAYYVLDGERPAAKSTTARKRDATRCRNKHHEIHRRVLNFLGPEREWMSKPVKVKKDGQELWQGSLPDYLLCRNNLWALVERLCENMEQVGALKGSGVDVFLARGWNSQYHSSSGWFRVAGERPETARPLRDYYNETNIDMEADAMMIRLGRLAVDHLQGPCLFLTVDTDVLVSLISTGSPDLYWAKQLVFKDRCKVVLRTTAPTPGSKRKKAPDCIDLRTISPLEEPAILSDFFLVNFPDTFFFAGKRFQELSKWSAYEAERRLTAVFVLLMAGCDFCEKVDSFGMRGVVKLLSRQPRLPMVKFSRITCSKNMTKDIELGMRHDCMVRLPDAVRFPWRCGNFLCLVEIDFASAKTLIQAAISPKRIEGRDWRPFIRRLCYSIMTLSAPGLGFEKEVKECPRLAQIYGYDSRKSFRYITFDSNELDQAQTEEAESDS